MSKIAAVSIAIVLLFLCGAARAQEKQLRKLQLAYGAASSSRIPYWVAKEAKLYEKYGLDANLVFISGAPVALNALTRRRRADGCDLRSGGDFTRRARRTDSDHRSTSVQPLIKLVAHPVDQLDPRIERKSHRHGPRRRCHRLCVAGPVAAVGPDPGKGRAAFGHGLEQLR